MQNDPRDLDGAKLMNALQLLGRDRVARFKVLELCRDIERILAYKGSCRDEITGPIVDALHNEDDEYQKQLIDGTRVAYLYRTKIARDLLFSSQTDITHFWEPQTTKLLIHLARLSQGDFVVGGAYFGDQAILVAKEIQDRGSSVHCFEPNTAQAAMLKKNADLNKLDNVSITMNALWDSPNQSMRLDGFDSFANVISTDSDDGFLTETIDEFTLSRDFKVGVIQLDIEGSELRALKGGERILKRDKPYVVFELHRSYVDWSEGLRNTEICEFLLSLDYSVYAIRDVNSHHEMANHLVELVEIDHVYLEGPPHGFNMVAFPKGASINDENFRIMRNVSPKLLPHKDPVLHHPTEGF